MSADLLSEVTAYCERVGMSRRSFGAMACGDPNLVYLMKRGTQLGPVRQQGVRAFLDSYPDGPPKGGVPAKEGPAKTRGPSVHPFRLNSYRGPVDESQRVDRDPCRRCGVRADAVPPCGHREGRLSSWG